MLFYVLINSILILAPHFFHHCSVCAKYVQRFFMKQYKLTELKFTLTLLHSLLSISVLDNLRGLCDLELSNLGLFLTALYSSSCCVCLYCSSS